MYIRERRLAIYGHAASYNTSVKRFTDVLITTTSSESELLIKNWLLQFNSPMTHSFDRQSTKSLSKSDFRTNLTDGCLPVIII